MSSLFTGFGRVISSPPYKNLKHGKYLNFENAHPLIQNYHGNVPSYSQNFYSFSEIFNNFFGLFKINVVTQNRGTLYLPNMLHEALLNFKYKKQRILNKE
jgi:hypothetical protein